MRTLTTGSLLARFPLFGLCSLPLQAQEGHPLSGTWQGEWDGHFLTLILSWDGKTITGVANPGPGTQAEVGSVQLDSSDWTVTIDTELKDDNGQPFRFRASGALDNIGSPLRVLNVDWQANGQQGRLTLVRQGGA